MKRWKRNNYKIQLNQRFHFCTKRFDMTPPNIECVALFRCCCCFWFKMNNALNIASVTSSNTITTTQSHEIKPNGNKMSPTKQRWLKVYWQNFHFMFVNYMHLHMTSCWIPCYESNREKKSKQNRTTYTRHQPATDRQTDREKRDVH